MSRLASRRSHLRGAQAVLCLTGLTLAGCAAGNTGAKLRVDHIGLPALPFQAGPAPIVLPPPCPAELLVDLQPEPPPQGGFPAPETAAASDQVQAYFGWLHSYAVWARTGWARAGAARAYCGGR